jgi:ribonuclease G
VVEISPLGLVEMTRQNVTDGPREILTKKCPTCAGDGIVLSEASAALEVERRLRTLAAGSRAQAFRIEVSPKTASLLLGAGGKRLAEIEEAAKKRFFLVPKEGVHADHAAVLAEGKLVDLQPEAPIAEGAEIDVKLVEVDKHDAGSAAGKHEGLDVVVGGAAKLVGKKAKVRVERVLDGVAYAALLTATEKPAEAITFESEAEKPTRAPSRAKKTTELEAEETEQVEAVAEPGTPADEPVEPELGEVEVADEPEDEPEEAVEGEATPAADGAPVKKKTRRGSRGGRNRKKKPAGATAEGAAATSEDGVEAVAEVEEDGAVASAAETEAPTPGSPRIHVPDFELGGEEKPARRRSPQKPKPKPEPAATEDGAEPAEAVAEAAEPVLDADGNVVPVKKKTRRGSRGGRNRKKPAAAAVGAAVVASENGADAPEPVVADQPEASGNGAEPATDDYVPMSEWLDDLDA